MNEGKDIESLIGMIIVTIFIASIILLVII